MKEKISTLLSVIDKEWESIQKIKDKIEYKVKILEKGKNITDEENIVYLAYNIHNIYYIYCWYIMYNSINYIKQI